MEECAKKHSLLSSVKENYLNSFRYIGRNILTIFLVAFICFTIVQLATSGFLKCLFLLAGVINGNGYMTFNNIIDYLKNPLIVIIALIYIIVLCNILFFQISLFVYIFEKSKEKQKINFKEMLNFGFCGMKKLLRPRNWVVYIFVLLIVPFADMFQFTYFQVPIVVPGFILDYILAKPYFAIPYIIVIISLIIFSLMSIFSFHYFLLEDISFIEACKKSIKAVWKQKWTNILVGIVVALSIAIATVIISCIIVFLICAFSGRMLDDTTFASYLDSFMELILVFVSLPIVFSVISSLFHFYQGESGIGVFVNKDVCSKVLFITRNVLIAAFVVVFATIDIVLNIDNYSVYTTKSSEPIIIAHRGSSIDAPENSIPAFSLAIEQGVDVIELDVHQTKDKVLVVCHDASLSRIAGINKNVYELTYKEICELDVGSWFSDKYKGLKMATLEEVFTLCKGKVKLLIEIKPTEYDDHLEEDLLELINEYDMKDEVSIHSLKTQPLEKLNKLDPTLEIAFCTNLAIGQITNMEWADYYTIEENSISPELVKTIHNAGKKIYAWTINTTDNTQYLIDCGVDGFIGDDPVMMKETIDECIYDKGFTKFLRMLSLQQLVM